MKIKSWRLVSDQMIGEAARKKLSKKISHAQVAPNAAKRRTFRQANKVKFLHERELKATVKYRTYLGVEGLKRFE